MLARYAGLTPDAPRELGTSLTVAADGPHVTACWSSTSEHAAAALSAYGSLGTPVESSSGATFLELQRRTDDHFAWGRRYCAARQTIHRTAAA